MRMREILGIIESNGRARTAPDPRLEHALWWLQRWISGSMNDPDWTWPEAESTSIEQAFIILGQTVGNRRALAKPMLWRSLILSKARARKIVQTRLLPPNPMHTFQSFSGSRKAAVEFGSDMPSPEGSVHVLVSIRPDASLIPFSMADLRAARHPKVKEALLSLDLWQHQDEVLVHVMAPLPLMSAEIQKPTG